ncbi:MAG: M56 family metallopeptidase [Acidobacteriaceae bacterium]
MTLTLGSVSASHAIGWSFVHFLWQGTVLAMALTAALKISERNSANLRYLLCCVAMAGMALCPVLTWTNIAFWVSNRSTMERPHSAFAGAYSAHGAEHSQIQYGSKELIDWTDRHMTAILVLWSIGVLLAFVRLLASLAAAKRLSAASVSTAPDRLQTLADQVAPRLKLAFSARLVVSSRVTTPAVVGWRRPVVILPPSFLAGLSQQEEESILAHELAHIRRRDYLVNVMQTAVEAVLFYHPAIWWVSRQIRREREHCCDDLALKVSGSPFVYARALTTLEEQRSLAKPELSLGAHGGDLSMRIKRLLEPDQRLSLGRTTCISLASLAVLTLGTLAILSITADRVSAQASEAGNQQKSAVIIATNRHRRPDMSCTFYDRKSLAHPGVCEASGEASGLFYCRQTGGDRLREIQSGCEWKVQRLRDWERQQPHSKQ